MPSAALWSKDCLFNLIYVLFHLDSPEVPFFVLQEAQLRTYFLGIGYVYRLFIHWVPNRTSVSKSPFISML
jgi:hypothetical protein